MSLKKALPSMSGNLPVPADDEEGPEYWQHHIDQWIRSGLSQAAYCRDHDLDYNRFRKWKERLSTYPSASTSIKLVEVKRDFTLNSHPGDSSSPSSSFISDAASRSSRMNNPGARGARGARGMVTGGSSGIRFWCGEFCIEVDVKFSSDTLKQLVSTLQGVYIKSGGKTDSDTESETGSEGVKDD
jgi:hypothetical protein